MPHIVNVNVRKHWKKQMLEVATANISMSKQYRTSKLAKKTLSLDEKVKFLDFAKQIQRLGVKKPAEIFNIGKPYPENIPKEKKIFCNQHELFREKSKK